MKASLVLLISLWLILAYPIQAQGGPAYDGLDIVFLVDQSGSMGGQAYGFRGPGTDPLGLRFEALQYAIDILGSYRLNFAKDYPINLAVVNFGSDVERNTPRNGWRTIAEDESLWERQREELLELFSADSFRATTRPANLGDTNFRAAFQEAINLFNELGTRNHLRVIIILTDGAPCVPQEMGNDCPLQGQQRHMERLIALVRGHFSAPNNLIFVVAFDEMREFWPRWEASWQQIAGEPERARLAQSSQEVGARFLDVLNNLFTQAGSEEAVSIALRSGINTIAVPPYVRELRISFFKSEATPANLTVTQPDGNRLSLNSPQVRITNSNRPIEVWYISRPTEGRWTFELDDARTRMSVYLAFLPLRVNVQIDEGPFSQYEDVVLRLQLRQEDGSPLLPPQAPYELKLTPSLIQPDGQRAALQALALTESQYEIRLRPLQSGEYKVELEVRATAAARPEVALLNAEVGRFRVSSSVLELLSSVANEYLEGDTLALSARLSREDGSALRGDKVVVEARLEGSSSLRQALIFNEAEGLYEGNLTLSFDGDATLIVEASLQDAEQRLPLGQPISQRLSILPSLPIGLRLRQPLSSEYFDTEGIPPANASLDILLETYTLADNRIIDLEAVAIDPDGLWQTEVRRNGIILDEQPLMVGEGQGRYRLPLGNLSLGTYELSLQAKGPLRDRFVLGADAALNLRFSVISNPSTQLFYVVLVLIALLALLIVAWIVWRNIDVRRHPCRGKLVIMRLENGTPVQEVWSVNLTSLRRNRIPFSRLPAEVKTATEVQRLLVECMDERMSKEGRVRVTISQKGKPRRVSSLYRGGSILLGSQTKSDLPGYDYPVTLDYQLWKDMEDYSQSM